MWKLQLCFEEKLSVQSAASKKNLKYSPYFDGRAVCYPSKKILQDYLAWRRVDCHVNNQYNTCFWMLVKSGKTKTEAQQCLKGTQTREKYELLSQQFGIDYNECIALHVPTGFMCIPVTGSCRGSQ